MTLEEAIKNCEQKSYEHSKCAEEHKQLAEWLKELQVLKDNCDNTDKILKRHPLCKNCTNYHPHGDCSKPDNEDCDDYEDKEEYRQKMIAQWRAKEPKLNTHFGYIAGGDPVMYVEALCRGKGCYIYGDEIARIYPDRHIEWTFEGITSKMRERVIDLSNRRWIDSPIPPHTTNFFIYY